MFRTGKRRNPRTAQPYPWLVRSTAMVDHYSFDAADRHLGAFFLTTLGTPPVMKTKREEIVLGMSTLGGMPPVWLDSVLGTPRSAASHG